MSDLRLDASGDLDLENGDLVFTQFAEGEAVRQHLAQRIRHFRGEWFLDTTAGVPYYQDVLVKRPNPQVLDAVFKDVIIGTPGITELLSFDLSFEGAQRKLRLSFEAMSSDGPINYSELLT